MPHIPHYSVRKKTFAAADLHTDSYDRLFLQFCTEICKGYNTQKKRRDAKMTKHNTLQSTAEWKRASQAKPLKNRDTKQKRINW